MKSKKQVILNIFTALVVIFSISFCLFRFLTGGVIIDGTSMSPTLGDLSEGKTIRTTYRKKHLKRFDIIIFDSKARGERLIKRVIALPGETVSIDNITGEITINGKIVLQNFIPTDDAQMEWEQTKRTTCVGSYNMACGKELTIPRGYYYVLGDNRNPGKSLDSEHGLGLVPYEEIDGVLWYVDTICEEIGQSNGERVCVKKKKIKKQYF